MKSESEIQDEIDNVGRKIEHSLRKAKDLENPTFGLETRTRMEVKQKALKWVLDAQG